MESAGSHFYHSLVNVTRQQQQLLKKIKTTDKAKLVVIHGGKTGKRTRRARRKLGQARDPFSKIEGLWHIKLILGIKMVRSPVSFKGH